MFSNLPDRDDDRAVLVRFALPAAATGDAELLGAALFALGATGIAEAGGASGDGKGGDDDGQDGGGIVLLAGFPNRSAARSAIGDLPATWQTLAVVDLPDDTWFDGWRAYARAQRAGHRLVVRPPWVPLVVEPPVTDDDVVLEIDPGRAFGSGAHPTTRLVLAELEVLVGPGTRVLDLGCGSGVLAIASARMGAAEVLAVDIDPEAVVATRANQARNGVTFPVLDDLGPEPEGARYDIVAANIGANTLIGLAETLVRWGHTLVLSGFFTDRADEVADAFTRSGTTTTRLASDPDGWCALTVTSPADLPDAPTG